MSTNVAATKGSVSCKVVDKSTFCVTQRSRLVPWKVPEGILRNHGNALLWLAWSNQRSYVTHEVNKSIYDIFLLFFEFSQGSFSPQPCSEGSYTPQPGSENPGDCIACQPGFFCSGEIVTDPDSDATLYGGMSGECEPGFYCPGESIRSNGQGTV